MSSRIREDQLSGSGSRPAYLDEFERKLAAALFRERLLAFECGGRLCCGFGLEERGSLFIRSDEV